MDGILRGAFRLKRASFSKLTEYGFTRDGGGYVLTLPLVGGQLGLTVRVTDGNYSAEPLTMQFSIVADGGEVTQ